MNKEQIVKKVKELKKQGEQLGIEVILDSDTFYENRLNCKWYGGNIGKLIIGKYTIIIRAIGDVIVSLNDMNGNLICFSKDKNNEGLFYEEMSCCIKDDKQLQENMDNDTLVCHNNNWVQYDILDTSTNEFLELPLLDNIIDDNNVLKAFEPLDGWFEVLKNALDFSENKQINSTKKTFKIPVEWSVFALVEIEAFSLKETVQIFDETIDDISLPTDNDYIDDSFRRGFEEDGNDETNLEYYMTFND
jgi:hypothetical protein